MVYSSPLNDRASAVDEHDIDVWQLGRIFDIAGDMTSVYPGRRLSPGRLIVVGGEGVRAEAIRFPGWIMA